MKLNSFSRIWLWQPDTPVFILIPVLCPFSSSGPLTKVSDPKGSAHYLSFFLDRCCSWNLPDLLSQFGFHGAPIILCSTVGFFSHILSLSSISPCYFFIFLRSFFLAVTWDCYNYHRCLLLLFIYHCDVWLISNCQFITRSQGLLCTAFTQGKIVQYILI